MESNKTLNWNGNGNLCFIDGMESRGGSEVKRLKIFSLSGPTTINNHTNQLIHSTQRQKVVFCWMVALNWFVVELMAEMVSFTNVFIIDSFPFINKSNNCSFHN